MSKTPSIVLNKRELSPSSPAYIIAEMSANHHQSFENAVKIVEAAKSAGADAIKIQTYTPDTITLNCDNPYFQIKNTIWEGKRLYQLYKEAYTPWEWQPKLKEVANRLDMDFFSSPFDETAVDFLEKINIPAYKVASFELVDFPLLKKIAETGKPVLLSTGMAKLSEIEEAVSFLKQNRCDQIALLKCTSAYPAPPENANLKTIPHLSQAFNVPVGLSDHTLGSAVAITAIAFGACIIEKHFCLTREDQGPDSQFSMEPNEFRQMVNDIRISEKAIGNVNYKITEKEAANRLFRKSLFAVEDIKKGDILTSVNIKSIRPGHGLHPKYYPDTLGKKAKLDIMRGTPLSWKLIG